MYVCIMYKSSFFKPRTSHLFTYGRTLTNHQNLINYPAISHDLAVQKSALSVCKRDDHVYSSWIHSIMLADWSCWPKSCLLKVDCWMSGLKFWLQKLTHLKTYKNAVKTKKILEDFWLHGSQHLHPSLQKTAFWTTKPTRSPLWQELGTSVFFEAKLWFQKRSTWRDLKNLNPHEKIISTLSLKINIGTKDIVSDGQKAEFLPAMIVSRWGKTYPPAHTHDDSKSAYWGCVVYMRFLENY